MCTVKTLTCYASPVWMASPTMQAETERIARETLAEQARTISAGSVLAGPLVRCCEPRWKVPTLTDHGIPFEQLHGESMARLALLDDAAGPMPAPVLYELTYRSAVAH